MLQIDRKIQNNKTGKFHENLKLSGRVEHGGSKSNKKERTVRQNAEPSAKVEHTGVEPVTS